MSLCRLLPALADLKHFLLEPQSSGLAVPGENAANPPSYQLRGPPTSTPAIAQFTTLSQTKALSTFLSVGRIFECDDFLALISAGAIAWDHRTAPPPGNLEKHGNVGAVLTGDLEAPLVRMRNVTLL